MLDIHFDSEDKDRKHKKAVMMINKKQITTFIERNDCSCRMEFQDLHKRVSELEEQLKIIVNKTNIAH